MTVPVCKDCIYHLPFEQTNYNGAFDRCTRKPVINRVSGKESYDNCGIERCYQSSCGPSGRYFVPKDHKPVSENILTQPEKPVSFWSKLKFWN